MALLVQDFFQRKDASDSLKFFKKAFFKKCLKEDSNLQPTRYECAALPVELFRHEKKPTESFLFPQFLFLPSNTKAFQRSKK